MHNNVVVTFAYNEKAKFKTGSFQCVLLRVRFHTVHNFHGKFKYTAHSKFVK